MSQYFDRDLAALDQIEDLLEAYADARLSPPGPVLARMRANVLREASRRSALAAIEERRAALEVAFLPVQVDQRLASREQHLDDRLAEAEAAAARGDLGGLAAALAAYQAEVDAAVAEVGDDAARLAHLEAELARHTAALQALAATVPEQAAIEHAIDTSQKAATKLKDRSERAGGKPSSAPDRPDSQQGR